MDKRYYTPKEVAAILEVSPDTVIRLVQSGQLAALRVSERLYRIPVPAFEHFQSGEPVRRRRVVIRSAETAPEIGEPVDVLEPV